MQNIKLLRVFFGSICIVMTGVTIYTSMQSNLFHVLPGMIRDPWTMATFIDFYFNIVIIFSWVAYREKHLWHALGWLFAFVALGSIATSFYIWRQLGKLQPGDSLANLLVRQI